MQKVRVKMLSERVTATRCLGPVDFIALYGNHLVPLIRSMGG